ncbi:amino acid permease [Candidatus Woesearchaeota archaeon]|nr:amino acid permease [Candidatus Woesearchaeota archaeon]MBW3016658.1 amino acid permease [Candidatus Woesearchaeota archaeon]
MKRVFFEAVATLTGCIIGAGILGIPFVIVKSGFWTGMLVVFTLGFAVLLLHLLMGEVCLRSKKPHQLAGYAESFLGRPGKFLMTASMVIGIYGAMLAYTLGVSESLFSVFGLSKWFWAFSFYVLMSALVFGGLKVLKKSELWIEFSKFSIFVIVLLILFSSYHFSFSRHNGFYWDKLLVPYGVILFSFIGTAAIPELRQELIKNQKMIKRVIVIGSLIPLVVYSLFAFAVIGVSGLATTPVATIGLADLIGGFGYVFLHVFAVLAMASSFVALGYALKDMYNIDFNIPHWQAWLLTMIVPAVLISLGADSFIGALEVAGVFAGGIAGLTVILMHISARRKSERQPEYKIKTNWIIYGLLALLFVIGVVYELTVLLF